MKRPTVKKARVQGFVVELELSDGSTVKRDFAFVTGPAFKRWRRVTGIDPRVHVGIGELSWPGGIDFDLDHILWGSSTRRRRPLRRSTLDYASSVRLRPMARGHAFSVFNGLMAVQRFGEFRCPDRPT